MRVTAVPTQETAVFLFQVFVWCIHVYNFWDDSGLMEIPAKTIGETRFMVIGKIGVKHWSVVITCRSDKIRIISVRRSRQSEVMLYESW